MTSITSRSSHDTSHTTPRRRGVPARADSPQPERDHAHRARSRRRERGAPLGRYVDSSGRRREVIARRALAGSVLVVDRDALTLGDPRLVAHLAADESRENAAVACNSYLEQVRHGPYLCRGLVAEDLHTVPFQDDPGRDARDGLAASDLALLDRDGGEYRLERVDTGMSIPELRWRRRPGTGHGVAEQSVSVREVVGALQSYEQVGAITGRALADAACDGTVSSAVIRVELTRMKESPIVLNRGLREAVVMAVERQGLSLSEIAMRCGRIKRDRAGKESGETSWLARRLGLLPEGGRSAPTPWIHSDVLALIARRGLGISPREVELPW